MIFIKIFILKIILIIFFFYKYKKKILILVSYIDEKSEFKLKIEIIKYLILRPRKFILLLKNISYFFKLIKYPKNFIQLLHFIINKSPVIKINKKIRDKKINHLHKKFISDKYQGIFAIYNNENLAANKYYKKNKFIFFNRNLFYSCVTRIF